MMVTGEYHQILGAEYYHWGSRRDRLHDYCQTYCDGHCSRYRSANGQTLIYILGVVAAIILFREMVPIVFNDYFFAYFLLSGLAAKAYVPRQNPSVWMAVTLAGGTILIFAILGIRKIVMAVARKRAIAAARL